MNRAYSLLEVKGIDEERRVIRGMATTPTPDRVNDIIEPLGAKFADDLPLFMHHDSRLVVGRTVFKRATSKGIPFEARLPIIKEAGALRDRVEEAWQSVVYKLITGVSIGFKPIADKIEQLKNGGLRFLECEILELSLVPVPMNAEAVITQYRSGHGDDARDSLLNSIKSADSAIRLAAFGNRSGGVVKLDPGHRGLITPGVSGSERRKGVVYLTSA